MSASRLLAITFISLWLVGPGATAFAGQVVGIAEKAALQAAMQRHIDERLVDGTYLHFDPGTGTVRELYPVKAHPQILMMGPYFVLCSDFRDSEGSSVNIDFYMARKSRSFVVFHKAVEDRDRLMALLKQGKVVRLD